MVELVTERLELRAWRGDDLDAYAPIAADPEVGRYLGATMDRAGAWRQIALFVGHRALRGWTQSAVVERSTGELVGRCGLWRPEGWPGLEIGWVLRRRSWGRGYATEAARAVRNHAFEVLAADEVISVIHPDNAASVQVAERIGSTYLRDTRVLGMTARIYGQRRP